MSRTQTYSGPTLSRSLSLSHYFPGDLCGSINKTRRHYYMDTCIIHLLDTRLSVLAVTFGGGVDGISRRWTERSSTRICFSNEMMARIIPPLTRLGMSSGYECDELSHSYPDDISPALVVISSFFLQSPAEFLRAPSNGRAFRT